LDVGACPRNGALDTIVGVRYRGKAQTLSGPVVLGGPQFEMRELAASGAIERIDLTSATAQASFPDASSASGSTALATHAYGKGQTTLFAFNLASSAAAGDKVGYGGVR
jgi:hypothetical protein